FHHSHVMIFLVARQIMGFFKCYFFLALEIIGQAPKAAAGGRFSNHNSSSVCTSQWLIFSTRSSSSFVPGCLALAIWLLLLPILPSSAWIFFSSAGFPAVVISLSRARSGKNWLTDMSAIEHFSLISSASEGVRCVCSFSLRFSSGSNLGRPSGL